MLCQLLKLTSQFSDYFVQFLLLMLEIYQLFHQRFSQHFSRGVQQWGNFPELEAVLLILMGSAVRAAAHRHHR